jgi:hypothetical protein
MKYLADFLQTVCSGTSITAGFKVLVGGIQEWNRRQSPPVWAPIPIKPAQRWRGVRSPMEAPLPLKQRRSHPLKSQGFR